MKKLLFATNNANKLKELQLKLPEYEIISLKEAGIHEDIPETAKTIEGNAKIKSQYVFDKYGLNCFSDDTGLEVEVLNGEPGVYSARYGGEEKNAELNMNKLLSNLEGKTNKTAQFKTVVSLMVDGKETSFEGIVKGAIIDEKRGEEGFGYDPIFVPHGYSTTFAEMGMDQKNKISHRALAVEKLIEYLNK